VYIPYRLRSTQGLTTKYACTQSTASDCLDQLRQSALSRLTGYWPKRNLRPVANLKSTRDVTRNANRCARLCGAAR